jgi:anti-sigma regulatory factor (Ser/Thr protein kinase)
MGTGAKTLTIRADLGAIDRAREFLRDNLRGLSLAEEDVMRIELSLHEILVNIALYAYPEARGEMSLRVWREDGVLRMEIRDRGVPFNPVERPAPDLEEKIRRGAKGGLGIHLFKSLMDGYAYRREAGENVLTVFKKI